MSSGFDWPAAASRWIASSYSLPWLIALWKMVGFDVTPVTPSSRRSKSRWALVIIPLRKKSSQMLCPALRNC